MIITQPFDHMLGFYKEILPLDWSEDLRLIGQVQNGDLTAVIAYNGFVGKICVMHVAAKGTRWITKELLWAAFDYPFNQCKVTSVIGLVAADNEKAIRLDEHLGFREVYRISDGFKEGVDLIVFQMDREQAEKHLALEEKVNGRKELASSSA